MTTEYLLEEICQLTIENKELKNRNAILGGFVTKVRSECRKRSEVKDDFFSMMIDSCNRILEQAPSQSLADIKADAVIEAANTLCIKGDSVITVRYDKYIEYADNLRSKS